MDEKLTYYRVEDRGKLPDKIKSVLEENEEIVIAIIFGSFLTRDKLRDIDIAIHTSGEIELEELIRLSSRIEDEIGIPAHMLLLMEMPPCIRYKAITKGLKILVRDMKLLHEIQANAFSECQDLKVIYTSKDTHWLKFSTNAIEKDEASKIIRCF